MIGTISNYELFSNSSVLRKIEHTYSDIISTKYQTVKISGNFEIDNKKSCDEGENCFIQEEVVLGSSSNGGEEGTQYTLNYVGKLVEVISWGDINYKTLNGMFYKAGGLYTLPNNIIPAVNQAQYTFAGCSSIIDLPDNFELSYNLLNATGMFTSAGLSGNCISDLEINKNLCVIDEMFAYCTDLTEKPSGFYKNYYMNVNYMLGKDNSGAFIGTRIENPDSIS